MIPRRLLPHSATLYPYTGTVASVKTYGTAVPLTFLRFESVKQNAMTSLGEMKNDRFVMACNIGQEFKSNDKITWNGVDLIVRKVSIGMGARTANHLEVNLV